jgi:hypothetical protein
MQTQGTKVLENREIRTTINVIREGAPATDIYAGIVKYDGKIKAPEWMDVERGRTLNFMARFLHPTFTIQKTILRLCAMFPLTFPSHHPRSELGKPGTCATTGSMRWFY